MPVAKRIAALTLDNLDDIRHPCRACVYWELGPLGFARGLQAPEARTAKEEWISQVLLEWGSCGKIAYVDDIPVGYILFAPPQFVPRALAFPTSPISGDAVLLMNAMVFPDWTSAGIGRMLAQSVAAELLPRGVKAIEAFGTMDSRRESCVMPVGYLRSIGFKTVRPHAQVPRMRMELKSTVTWRRYDVETALERILASAGVGKARTPIGQQRVEQ
jgi:GNAT superfamily N-acetyltransferase